MIPATYTFTSLTQFNNTLTHIHRYVVPILIRMIRTGKKVNIGDVPSCPRADNPTLQANRMRELLKNHSAFVSYFWFVWPNMRAGIFLSAMSLGAVFVQAIANRNVVIYLQNRYYNSTSITSDDEVEGYAWAFLIPFLTLCASLFGQHSMMFGKFAARRAYAAFCTLLFEKPSQITSGSLSQLEEGTVLNMMSVDCLSVANITMFLQFASTALVMILASSIQIVYVVFEREAREFQLYFTFSRFNYVAQIRRTSLVSLTHTVL